MTHGGTRTRWTPREALDALYRLATLLGRTPFAREIGTRRCPSTSYFKKHFGSFRAAVVAAGLRPNAEGGIPKHGRYRRLRVVPIEADVAARITEQKRAWWLAGCPQRTSWVHPYARRSA